MPCAPNDARRQEIAKWVRAEWIEKHHPNVPIFEGVAVGAGNARNAAARAAGDWDVAVFNDSDTIADPRAVRAAIDRAALGEHMVVAADSHMYCSEGSSDRIMAGGLFMPRPYRVDTKGVGFGIVNHPCSGIFAVSRKLWDATGGYIELMADGNCEDQAFMEMTRIFGGGISHIPDYMTYHMWHPPGPDRWQKPPPNYQRNHTIWQALARIAKTRHPHMQKRARDYLATLGHHVP